MKILIDVIGDFESNDEILEFIITQLNGTSYTTNVLYCDENRQIDDGIKFKDMHKIAKKLGKSAGKLKRNMSKKDELQSAYDKLLHRLKCINRLATDYTTDYFTIKKCKELRSVDNG